MASHGWHNFKDTSNDSNNNSPIPVKKSRLEMERSRLEVERKETAPSDLPCFCDRKPTGIYCNNCHTFTPNVRVKRACPRHPQVLWLMDLASCPKCLKETNLMELSR